MAPVKSVKMLRKKFKWWWMMKKCKSWWLVQSNDILRPPESRKKYKTIILDGLAVLLVSDPDCRESAACVRVQCGNFDDPKDMPGLAHLVEHVVLLGSHKFPRKNQLREFVHKHGGTVEGATELDHSYFAMSVKSTHFPIALKMFADSFINPRFDFKLFQKEIEILDSEWELEKYKDINRLETLILQTARETHPFHLFPWGNKFSFSRVEKNALYDGACKLFKANYIAGKMNVVVTSSASLNQLFLLVRSSFEEINHPVVEKGMFLEEGIQRQPCDAPVPSLRSNIWKSNIAYYLESVQDYQGIHLKWIFPPKNVTSRPEKFIEYLLKQENDGSLSSFLKRKGWVTSVDVSLGNDFTFGESSSDACYHSTVIGDMFCFEAALTETGWENRYEVISHVYQYLSLIEGSPLQSLIDDFHTLLELKYMALDYDGDLSDPFQLVQGLAGNMLKAPWKYALSLDFLYNVGNDAEIAKTISHLTPENMRLDFFSKPFADLFEDFEKEPYFDSKYREVAIPDLYTELWSKPQHIDPNLSLPSRSNYFPSRESFLSELANVHSFLKQANTEDASFDLRVDDPASKLFYKLDHSALMSYASFNIYFNLENDAKSQIRTKIIFEMMIEDLSVLVAKGKDSYIDVTLDYEDNMLILGFDGFGEHLANFIIEFVTKMKSFSSTNNLFEIALENLKSDLRSRDLSEQAKRILFNAIIDENLDEELSFLMTATFEDVQSFSFPEEEILVVGVCSGKLSEQNSIDIINSFDANGTFDIANDQLRKRLLPGTPFRITSVPFSLRETNSLAMVYYQIPCDHSINESSKETVALQLLNEMIQEYLYLKLRMNETLGYSFGSDVLLVNGTCGLYVFVASNRHKPPFLLGRIHSFIDSIGAFLVTRDDDFFQSYVRRTKALLPKDSGIHRDLISDVSRIKNRSKVARAVLRNMKKNDVVELYQNLFSGKLTIEICISGE